MIKRVEGGGLGRMNPMGWYNAKNEATSPRRQSESRSGDLSPRRTSNGLPEEEGQYDSPAVARNGEAPAFEAKVTDENDEAILDERETPPPRITDSPPPMEPEE